MPEFSEADIARIEAASDAATKNAKAAVLTSEKTREELTARIVYLEGAVGNLSNQLVQVEQKINTMMGERFQTGSTIPAGETG